MKIIMRKIFCLTISVLFVLLGAYSCQEPEETTASGIDVSFAIPEYVEATEDDGVTTLTFQILDGKAPIETDEILLESEAGTMILGKITDLSSSSFSAVFTSSLPQGSYTVFIRRDGNRKQIGNRNQLYVTIVSGVIPVEPDPESTVYGLVTCDGDGIPGVVVSDGVEVTVTDENGFYQMASDKKWGYVFISVPSGYEVPSDGILPQFHHYLKAAKNEAERADFVLTEVPGQDDFKLLVFGDMHLANRTSDLSQFRNFTNDVSDYLAAHSSENIYALTLGDMTWDLYWYSNSYAFPDYLFTMNQAIDGLQIFHTMGNHDNDMKTFSDFDAATQYVNNIAPTFYSFNIGKVHFIVIDDIDCSNYDGTDSRNYKKTLSSEQLAWLRKDLSYVSKGTPLIISTHAQIFYPVSSSSRFRIDHDTSNTNQLFDILDGYKVHFLTGHTHMIFNVVPEENIVGGRDIFEHNAGSVCASWWWSGHLTSGINISLDGAPGGYSIWDINGTDMEWLYKATGKDEDYQFRSYDLNNVAFSLDDVPNLTNTIPKLAFQKYISAYPGQSDNKVLINIWNWNPDWTLTVTGEDGRTLEYTEEWAYDPLHIAALTVKRFNSSTITSSPNFITEKFTHFFKVTAASADEDLTITVKDEFGHTWTENMVRPKPFSTDAYK